MKKTLLISLWIFLLSFQLLNAAEKPNIILIFTDDHGYADLGVQGIVDDVKTPHMDSLARGGVRMTEGYSTAPQCGPSRIGLISGVYQNRIGYENNNSFKGNDALLERFRAMETFPKRLQKAGYATGMAGKSHLGSNESGEICQLGFDQVFLKNNGGAGHWNMNLEGEDLEPQEQRGGYHLDMVSSFACTFIERYKDQPFFFFASYRAPHTPLDATPEYLARFPDVKPESRRKGLAMLAAVDDGVGRMLELLRKHKIEENTLIFVIGDNGAPLKKRLPGSMENTKQWDGSFNDPLNGEKGTLIDGGIRTPFVVYWKGIIPPDQVYSHPVIALDVAATANSLAGHPDDPELDGINLIPFLTGEKSGSPHEALYWRWTGQSAIRKGKWKYLRGDDREYLFDLDKDISESTNLLVQHPDKAKELHAELQTWSNSLLPPGLAEPMPLAGRNYFDWYLDGIRPIPSPKELAAKATREKAERIALFEKCNTDGDDIVSYQEFLTAHSAERSGKMRRKYDQLKSKENRTWRRKDLE